MQVERNQGQSYLQDEKARKEKHLEAMRLRCREHHDALASAKQDIRRLKKTIKTLEVSRSSKAD